MKTLHVKVDNALCEECALALRRFIGNLDGVGGITVERGVIAVGYDESKIPDDRIEDITRSSVEKLGYRIED